VDEAMAMDAATAFKTYDVGARGSMSHADIEAMMKDLGYKVDASYTQGLMNAFAEFDSDADGSIGRDEFAKLWEHLGGGDTSTADLSAAGTAVEKPWVGSAQQRWPTREEEELYGHGFELEQHQLEEQSRYQELVPVNASTLHDLELALVTEDTLMGHEGPDPEQTAGPILDASPEVRLQSSIRAAANMRAALAAKDAELQQLTARGTLVASTMESLAASAEEEVATMGQKLSDLETRYASEHEEVERLRAEIREEQEDHEETVNELAVADDQITKAQQEFAHVEQLKRDLEAQAKAFAQQQKEAQARNMEAEQKQRVAARTQALLVSVREKTVREQEERVRRERMQYMRLYIR